MAILFPKHCSPDVNNDIAQLRNAILSSSHVVMQWKAPHYAIKTEPAAVLGYKPRAKTGIAILSLFPCFYWSQ